MPRIPIGSGCSTWQEWLDLPEEEKQKVRDKAKERHKQKRTQWIHDNPDIIKTYSQKQYTQTKEIQIILSWD